MQITPVSDVLAPVALRAPTLAALVPDVDNYKVLLMQPHGEIEGSIAGVRNRDSILAGRQFGRFLDDARETQADLVVTPEYSMPWAVLVGAIKGGIVPAQGKLWVLGCESITYSELENLKQDLAPLATVLCETLQPDAHRFTDPLAYVFLAPPMEGAGPARIVVLVQFKTHPMGDDNHFEINSMQRGTHVYRFGDVGVSLSLVSLICSDVFDFHDVDAAAIFDRALVIHIQLNPKPRQDQYRRYRNCLLAFNGDATELLCLNWARDVNEWSGGLANSWHNIAGSAWYLKPNKFDESDATLCANHRRGFYYTWLRPLRVHALFFNFEPATYLLEATKVAHIGVLASISRRRGPQLTKTCIWNDAASAWVEQVAIDDGFAAVVGESGHAKDEIKRIADRNPLEAERILALCAGKIGNTADWYGVRQLDSCVINEAEIIRRLTFCQDTDQDASEFRIRRLKHCAHLWDVLKIVDRLPPALVDLSNGFRLEWSSDYPHQNAMSANGQRATVIYMGEDVSYGQVEATAKTVAEFLHRTTATPSEGLTARQRLAVWFRGNNGDIHCFDTHRYAKIDQTGNASEFDIGREQ